MSEPITATFKQRLQGALGTYAFVPHWATEGIVDHFWLVLSEEAREKTDPDSPALFARLKASNGSHEYLAALQEFCK